METKQQIVEVMSRETLSGSSRAADEILKNKQRITKNPIKVAFILKKKFYLFFIFASKLQYRKFRNTFTKRTLFCLERSSSLVLKVAVCYMSLKLMFNDYGLLGLLNERTEILSLCWISC